MKSILVGVSGIDTLPATEIVPSVEVLQGASGEGDLYVENDWKSFVWTLVWQNSPSSAFNSSSFTSLILSSFVDSALEAARDPEGVNSIVEPSK